MNLRSILIFLLALAFANAAAGQDGKRVDVPTAAVSFVQPAFLAPMDVEPGLFQADPDRFGPIALFILSPHVKLQTVTKAQADAFELMMGSAEYQRQLAKEFISGLGSDLFKSVTVEKTEFVTLNQLPAVRIFVNMMYGDTRYRSTVLVYYSRKNNKSYYVGWLGSEKYFDELVRAIQPAVDSIEFK